MKKIMFFCFCLALLFPKLISAQGMGGLKGGLNYAAFSGGNNIEEKFKTDLMVGGFLEIPVIEYGFHFQPEIVYSRQGAKQGSSRGGNQGIVTNLNYINLPVIGKFYIGNQFNIQAGPQMGVLLGANETADGVVVVDDLEPLFNTLAFSFCGGLGFDLDNKWRVSTRANIDILNIRNKAISSGTGNDPPAVRNIVVQLGVGYVF